MTSDFVLNFDHVVEDEVYCSGHELGIGLRIAAVPLPRRWNGTRKALAQRVDETATAMAWLERSVDTGFACWPFFRIDPHLERVREHPDFVRLVAHLEQKYVAL